MQVDFFRHRYGVCTYRPRLQESLQLDYHPVVKIGSDECTTCSWVVALTQRCRGSMCVVVEACVI